MLATIVLTNTEFAILCILAFVGVWHIIGIPPVKDWGSRKKQAL